MGTTWEGPKYDQLVALLWLVTQEPAGHVGFGLGNPYIYSTRPDSTNQFKIMQLVTMAKEYPTEK